MINASLYAIFGTTGHVSTWVQAMCRHIMINVFTICAVGHLDQLLFTCRISPALSQYRDGSDVTEKPRGSRSIRLVAYEGSRRNGGGTMRVADPIASECLVTVGCDDTTELPTSQPLIDERMEDANTTQLLCRYGCDGGGDMRTKHAVL